MSSSRSGTEEWPESGDIVIALMGMSGSGKSQFIDQFRPSPRPHVEAGIDPGTQRVAMYKCHHPSMKAFWLIDTIGFNDQGMTDAQVLYQIVEWMNRAYLRAIRLTGIIYMHSIEETRFPLSAMRNVDLFERLVGRDALRTVLLVTTFWDQVPDSLDRTKANDNERELQRRSNFWGGLMSAGAQIDRHYNTVRSALDIIQHVISLRVDCGRAVWTRVQREMGRGDRLGETGVGREVGRLLDEKERTFDQDKYDIDRERHRLLDSKDRDHQRKLQERKDKHKRDRDRIKDDREILQTRLADVDQECEELRLRVRGTDEPSLRQRDEILRETRELRARLAEIQNATSSRRRRS